jgi:prepilin-type N-terminal cleavage/methylation domain-containing protein
MNKKGFTIIETLVAIAILMIAISGPLVIASKGLTAALYAKDQSAATFLAVEGMELIRNMKDVAVAADPLNGFTNLFSPIKSACSDRSHTCPVWFGNDNTNPENCSTYKSCLLYQNPSDKKIGYYNVHNGSTSGLQPSLFSRSYFVTKVNNSNDYEYQITVIVTWNEGRTPNEVSITSDMTGTRI